MEAVNNQKGGVFFISGYGGTGKTFMWNTLSAALRSKRKIVLNAASSGIALLLLPGGRTAHSKFKIPILESSICTIEKGSDLAELLKLT
jgi:ATP-dependent DNA helicase PIF1